MKKYIQLLGIAFIALFIVNHFFSDEYGSATDANLTTAEKQNDSLLNEIKKAAKELYIAPIDARIDRVWKAIPGLNGVKVDVEASYKKMKSDGQFNKEKLVYVQIKPTINLNDLPPSPIYKGHPDKQMVSLLINVAWGNEFLPQMLSILKEHHIHASFFLEGRWVHNNPELAKMIIDAGHEIGNHSYTHPKMEAISAQKTREEIKKTNEVIQAITDKPVQWFAPPSGGFREETIKIAAEENLGTVLWTVDTVDWNKPTSAQLLQRVLSKVDNGSMILMHPTAVTAASLEQLVVQLKQRNFQISTVSELLSTDRPMK